MKTEKAGAQRELCGVLSMREAAREIGITGKELASLVKHCEVNTAVKDGRPGIPRDEVSRLRSLSE